MNDIDYIILLALIYDVCLFGLSLLIKGSIDKQLRLIVSQISIPFPWISIIIPATTGAINALIAKHCENNAMDMPLYLRIANELPSMIKTKQEIEIVANDI